MKLSSRRLLLLLSILVTLAEYVGAHEPNGGSSGRPATTSPAIVAGFRAAYNLSTYPNAQFPSAAYWTTAGRAMAARFNGAEAAAIWIVSLYLDNGYTQLGFPASGRTLPYVAYAPTDYSEEHLNHFDSTGVKIWLQVEPGAAHVETLIDLVLSRYGRHPCVIGLGIDVEWFHANTHTHGRKVTDAEARRWERRVQSFNPGYRLFLKHYGEAWMPPLYRGDILFVDDSQQFYSLPAMISEFRLWGERFSPNQVAFQFGYPADKAWWGELADPPTAVGKALLAEIPNAHGLFWVDFTISQVFPKPAVLEPAVSEPEPVENLTRVDNQPSFTLVQHYLNSVNQTIEIIIDVPEPSQVRVEVYNAKGDLVDIAADRILAPGIHRLSWRPRQTAKAQQQTGLYYYTMKTMRRTLTTSLYLLP